MKVLGIIPGSNELRCAIVEGTVSLPSLDKGVKVQRINTDTDDGRALRALFQFLSTWLLELKPQKICILPAGNSKFGGPSPARLKIEAVLQLAGAELAIETTLIAPQTLRAPGEEVFRKDFRHAGARTEPRR
jgi:hypothetical protein